MTTTAAAPKAGRTEPTQRRRRSKLTLRNTLLGWSFINPANHTPMVPAATTYVTPEGVTHIVNQGTLVSAELPPVLTDDPSTPASNRCHGCAASGR